MYEEVGMQLVPRCVVVAALVTAVFVLPAEVQAHPKPTAFFAPHGMNSFLGGAAPQQIGLPHGSEVFETRGCRGGGVRLRGTGRDKPMYITSKHRSWGSGFYYSHVTCRVIFRRGVQGPTLAAAGTLHILRDPDRCGVRCRWFLVTWGASTPATCRSCVDDRVGPAPTPPRLAAARAFLITHWTNLYLARYADVWRTLHPTQRAKVSEDTFIRCWSRFPAVTQINLTRIEVSDGWAGEEVVRGSAVISFVDDGATRTDNLETSIVFWDGAWRWLLSQSSLVELDNGYCP
jgi:hypothetical protein